jgi:hypothetical protein
LDRFSRAIRRIKEWCREHRHDPIEEQHRVLSQKLRGHDAYYGVTGNGRALDKLRQATQRIWFKWLSRRSQRSREPWAWMQALLKRFPLPPARVIHSVYRTPA